jgi:hypothetical protein
MIRWRGFIYWDDILFLKSDGLNRRVLLKTTSATETCSHEEGIKWPRKSWREWWRWANSWTFPSNWGANFLWKFPFSNLLSLFCSIEGAELRALSLLGRCSGNWAPTSSPFLLLQLFFQVGALFWPGASLTQQSTYLVSCIFIEMGSS